VNKMLKRALVAFVFALVVGFSHGLAHHLASDYTAVAVAGTTVFVVSFLLFFFTQREVFR